MDSAAASTTVNSRQTVREAAEHLIQLWAAAPDAQTLDLPVAVKAVDRERLGLFCEHHGLRHELHDSDDGIILRVLLPLSTARGDSTSAAASTAAAPSTSAAAAPSTVAASSAAVASSSGAAASTSTAQPAAAAPPAAAATQTALTAEQQARMAASRAAAIARRNAPRSAAAAPAPVVHVGAPADTAAAARATLDAPPPHEGGQSTIGELSGVQSVVDLSDSLGVSSALYLGAHHMLKLRAILEQPDDKAQGMRALRRFSMARLTSKLEEATGILAFMRELSTDETVQDAAQLGEHDALEAVTLSARTVRAWEMHLDEERRQKEATAAKKRPAPAGARAVKEKDPGVSGQAPCSYLQMSG